MITSTFSKNPLTVAAALNQISVSACTFELNIKDTLYAIKYINGGKSGGEISEFTKKMEEMKEFICGETKTLLSNNIVGYKIGAIITNQYTLGTALGYLPEKWRDEYLATESQYSPAAGFTHKQKCTAMRGWVNEKLNDERGINEATNLKIAEKAKAQEQTIDEKGRIQKQKQEELARNESLIAYRDHLQELTTKLHAATTELAVVGWGAERATHKKVFTRLESYCKADGIGSNFTSRAATPSQVSEINKLISSHFSSRNETLVKDTYSISFENKTDFISQEEFDENNPNTEWCALMMGDTEGKPVFTLTTADSMNGLINSASLHPVLGDPGKEGRRDLRVGDIVRGPDLIALLKK
jgi:hypothetical protein